MPATLAKRHRLPIRTVADLRAMSVGRLARHFGSAVTAGSPAA